MNRSFQMDTLHTYHPQVQNEGEKSAVCATFLITRNHHVYRNNMTLKHHTAQDQGFPLFNGAFVSGQPTESKEESKAD